MRRFVNVRSGMAWACGAALLASSSAFGQRQMEALDRGVNAVAQDEKTVFVSWRLLGTEPADTAFNVYRASGNGPAEKLTSKPSTAGTWIVDDKANLAAGAKYTVRAVRGGREEGDSRAFELPAGATPKPYLSVPLQTPEGYNPNDASVGDLDGDGRYEIILHQAGRGRDNSQAGETDPAKLQAYTLDGKLMWSIDLGKNIREGAHYTQFMVYDFDGDGRAEIACKTADGTTDGTGKVIGDANADHRNDRGYVLRGPEFLTVFDGLTGRALDTAKYLPGRHPETDNPTSDQLKEVWGDGYGNRGDRFLAAVAYLDGVHPSIVMCRGYYTRTVLAAWDFRGGKLQSRWVFDSAKETKDKDGRDFGGQGNHNLTVTDVDGDGKDEIIYGAMVVNSDGRGRFSTGIGHGDALHVSDLDPTRPGLEVFRIQEPFGDAGSHMYDAKTGEVLWRRASVQAGTGKREGPGRGLAIDIDPRHPGAECWSAGAGITGLVDARGKLISDTAPRNCNFAVWWDGDELRELLDGTTVSKWDYENNKADPILQGKDHDVRSINGTKSTPALSADLFGDWREEIIWPTNDGRELRIFSTTIPTDRRLPTLMHDPQYRLSIAWQNVAYNQPPHTSFFIGADMKTPPKPDITLVQPRRSAAR
ncbi:MAG TPA: rhamnogalacturonan lyase [Tepidisphaeraceae bacterium]|jgi:rhamnogalacturonan endolyase